MTKNQLTRLSRSVLAEMVLDRDESLGIALAIASAPPEPVIAARRLGLVLRDRLAGIALGLIEAGELAYSLGCAARRALSF